MEIYNENDFVTQPVDIETFINNEEYLGKIYGGRIYPYWVERLKEIFPTPYSTEPVNVGISGALGTGRTVASIVGMLYDLHRLILVKDPHVKWKLLSTTNINFALFSQDGQSISPIRDSILDAIDSSPFFMKHRMHDDNAPLSRLFPNNIGITVCTSVASILGTAIVGIFVESTAVYEMPLQELYDKVTALRRRSFTRFGSNNGTPCRNWFIGEIGTNVGNLIDSDDGVFWKKISPAIWEAQAHKGVYSGNTFTVNLGSETVAPYVVKELNAPLNNTIQVPVEYYSEFEKDTESALRDLAGLPVLYKHV